MREVGQVVLSLSGHDKDRLYVVVKAEDGFCYIADGRRRRLGAPKKKNPRHLRATALYIRPDRMESDKALRRALVMLGQEADPASTREESCLCQKKTSSR